jgi:hypothetical protein
MNKKGWVALNHVSMMEKIDDESRLFKTCSKNYQVQLNVHVNFSIVCTLPVSQMHIYNVSIATVQGLKNVSQKV